MFIKLTRLDNSPIWLNASFIVTVEPRKGGGAIVVPIGDGLDYDVHEKPEDVLAMVERAPAPVVVPVPVSDCLTKTPEDVSPESEPPIVGGQDGEGVAAVNHDGEAAVAPEKTKKTTRKTAAKAKAPAKPRKRATAKKAEESETAAPEAVAEPPVGGEGEGEGDPATAASPTPSTDIFAAAAVDLTDSQIERLRKMMPRSVRKLANTLMAQFNVLDAMPVIRRLAEGGIFRLEDDHVIWA